MQPSVAAIDQEEQGDRSSLYIPGAKRLGNGRGLTASRQGRAAVSLPSVLRPEGCGRAPGQRPGAQETAPTTERTGQATPARGGTHEERAGAKGERNAPNWYKMRTVYASVSD